MWVGLVAEVAAVRPDFLNLQISFIISFKSAKACHELEIETVELSWDRQKEDRLDSSSKLFSYDHVESTYLPY